MAEKEKAVSMISDLNSELVDFQEALQNLIFQKSMQQLEDLSQIKKTRKKIARLKTRINENNFSDNS